VYDDLPVYDLAANEPEENGALHDVVEQEPEENAAAMEQSHVLEIEQNTLDNGGSVVQTAHSHKSTGKKGRPKRKALTRSPRKVVFQGSKHPLFYPILI